MPPPWARGAQLRIIGEVHGQATVNVLHMATNQVVNDEAQLNALLLAAVTALKECVVDLLLPAVTSDWKFVKCDGRIVYPVIGDPIEVTGQPENVGELSPTSHSISSSLLKVKTGIGGRTGKGRMFLPPPGESEIAQSTVDGPTLVLIAAFAACLAEKFMGANRTTDWEFGVLSRKLAGVINGDWDAGFRAATSLSPVADLCYMGTRRKGRGI